VRAGLAVAVVVFVGCGGGGEPAPRPSETPGTPAERPEPSDRQQIADLFEARAAALEARDPRAYAATGRRRDREHVRGARRLPLRDVTLVPTDIRVAGDRARVRVESSYRIAGVRGTFEADYRARVTPHA
jgi:hypothetical protein